MVNPKDPAPKAKIAWLIAAGGNSTAPSAAAETAGYQLFEIADRSMGIDIVVIDLRAGGSAIDVAATIARARNLAPAAGVLIIADPETPAPARAILRRDADAAFLGADASPIIALIREKLRLASLADELGDRIRSLAADNRHVTFTGLSNEFSPLSVLIAGRPSPAALGACNAVRRAASKTICVFSAGQAMRAIEHSHFGGAVFLPADDNDLLLALARALRRHRDHRRLPIFIAANDDALLDRCAARDGFQTILADHLTSDLAHRLQRAARRTALAATMRSFLRSPEGCAGSNGVASARFFAVHANRIIQRDDIAGRPMAIAGLAIVARAQPDGERIDALPLDEALRTAGRLVRAEDLIAKLTQTTLIVLLRNTRADEAARVAARLEGVISGTLRRSTLKIAVVKAASVIRAPSEDLETTIARLYRSLRTHDLQDRALG